MFRYGESDPGFPAHYTGEVLLEEIRRRGYAVSLDEQYEGVASIAAPIYSGKGKVAASLSITGRTHKISHSQPQLVKLVVQTAETISQILGRSE